MSEPEFAHPLCEQDVDPNPFAQFDRWFADAAGAGVRMPEAAAIATATADGEPSARMVLVKEMGSGGFVFYTNYESRKGSELAANPRAALLFYWDPLGRQVRIEGPVERLTAAESSVYVRSRPHGSQLSALASPQSRVVAKPRGARAPRRRAGDTARGWRPAGPRELGRLPADPRDIRVLAAPRGPPARSAAVPARAPRPPGRSSAWRPSAKSRARRR